VVEEGSGNETDLSDNVGNDKGRRTSTAIFGKKFARRSKGKTLEARIEEEPTCKSFKPAEKFFD
jgi:hypothetical protein